MFYDNLTFNINIYIVYFRQHFDEVELSTFNL